MRGVFGLAPLFPGGPGGTKPLLFTTRKPSQMWRYRLSLVSKGRFTTSINVICVGIRSSLSKRRYRVVIDHVGDLLRHRSKAGRWLFRGL
jgi:hypothetical protein